MRILIHTLFRNETTSQRYGRRGMDALTVVLILSAQKALIDHCYDYSVPIKDWFSGKNCTEMARDADEL